MKTLRKRMQAGTSRNTVRNPLSLVIALGFTALLCGRMASYAVQVGDSERRVLSELGMPRGRLERGDLLYLNYDRGNVVLYRGRVRSANLRSEREARADRSSRLQQISERRAAEERLRQARIREGTAAREARKASEDFQELPAEERLAYWREFQKKYPDVSVLRETVALKSQLAKEARQKKETRLAELNDQIMATDEQIDTLANKTDLGRTALIKARYELERLRSENEAMRKERDALQKELKE